MSRTFICFGKTFNISVNFKTETVTINDASFSFYDLNVHENLKVGPIEAANQIIDNVEDVIYDQYDVRNFGNIGI